MKKKIKKNMLVFVTKGKGGEYLAIVRDVVDSMIFTEFLNGRREIHNFIHGEIKIPQKNEIINYLTNNLISPILKLDLSMVGDKHNLSEKEIFDTIAKIICSVIH